MSVQCVQNKGTSSNPDVKVVDCASSDAEYKIVGKLDDTDRRHPV